MGYRDDATTLWRIAPDRCLLFVLYLMLYSYCPMGCLRREKFCLSSYWLLAGKAKAPLQIAGRFVECYSTAAQYSSASLLQ
jgi:hypothetical protein